MVSKGFRMGGLIGFAIFALSICEPAHAASLRKQSDAEQALRCEVTATQQRASLLREMATCRHRFDLGIASDLDACIAPHLARYDAAVSHLGCERDRPTPTEGGSEDNGSGIETASRYGYRECFLSCLKAGLGLWFSISACSGRSF